MSNNKPKWDISAIMIVVFILLLVAVFIHDALFK